MNIDEIRPFLLARIAEDEEWATLVQSQHIGGYAEIEPWKLSWHDEHDLLCVQPSRALIECAAKRATIADEPKDPMPDAFDLWTRELLRLAAPYVTHPDFDPKWRAGVPTQPRGGEMSGDDLTPEQQDRAAAERDPSLRYEDGRPKMHRHFAEFQVHADWECTRASRKIRVYVFDTEDLERHERFITERARSEAFDVVVAVAAARRPAAVVPPNPEGQAAK